MLFPFRSRNLPAAVAAGFTLLSGVAAFGQSAPAPVAAGNLDPVRRSPPETGAPSAPVSSLDRKLDSPFAAFRVGIVVSPVLSIDAGLDVTFPRLRLGPSWTTRADLDLSAHFNSRSFGSRRDAAIDVSFCQVYTPGGLNRGRYFLGAGIGPSIGPRSGFGAKLFAGINFTPVVSVEAEERFSSAAPARAVLMLRLSAL